MASIHSKEGSFQYLIIFIISFVIIAGVLIYFINRTKTNGYEAFWGENLGELYDYDFSSATFADGRRYPFQQNQIFPNNEYPELLFPNRNTIDNQGVPNDGILGNNLKEKYDGWTNFDDPLTQSYETTLEDTGVQPPIGTHQNSGRYLSSASSKNINEGFTSISNTGLSQEVIPQPKLPRDMNDVDSPAKWSMPSRLFPYQGWYPNINLPAHVIGCGGRNIPCMGGRQIAIQNQPWVKDVSENNIAPVNIATINDWKKWRYVGKLYKIWGDYNYTYPLYARKLKSNPFDDHWEYATEILNKRRGVHPKRKTGFLGDNDIVYVDDGVTPWRVTMFENKFPVSIPNQLEKTV